MTTFTIHLLPIISYELCNTWVPPGALWGRENSSIQEGLNWARGFSQGGPVADDLLIFLTAYKLSVSEHSITSLGKIQASINTATSTIFAGEHPPPESRLGSRHPGCLAWLSLSRSTSYSKS